MRYKFIDNLTSDVLYESYGKDLKEVFENSALALFDVMCELKKIEKKDKVLIDIKAEDQESLLYRWLQELIAQADIEEMFFSRFDIKEISDTNLKAEIYGESISPGKGKVVVKAVTNYKFSLEKTKKGYQATISLDI
jgi:SHS2 domain-containing protein